MKSFETWEYEDIQLCFGVRRADRLDILDQWLETPVALSSSERDALHALQLPLIKFVDNWNEDELKFFFISPLVNLVNYQHEKFHPFTQRKLAARIADVEVGGVVDFMVATGIQHPRQPFFFLHEYKQERKRENDPLGQLLIAMLAAQANNHHAIPLYGAYIVGRNWFFVTLQEREYAVSLAYDATKDELNSIFVILKQAKRYIEACVAQVGAS